jgi:ABC-type glycerol-3-phosphate transport system substrate-binding protein
MRKKTLFRGSIAVSTAAILAAGVLGTPARAADPVTITIWTFGDVIQRQLVQE